MWSRRGRVGRRQRTAGGSRHHDVQAATPSEQGPTASAHVEIHARGLDVLDDPQVNRGTAFTMAERDHLGLHGLLPPALETLERAGRPLATSSSRPARPTSTKWTFLTNLHDSNEVLFYRLVGEHVARDAADRLHAHGRRGDPGVQPPVPPPARRLPQHRGRRRHRPGAGRHRPRPGRHRPGRRLRRRGHPRHRRLGRRRHRHLDRQARGLHGRRRHRPEPRARRRPRRRHQPRGAAQRPALPRPAPLAGARRDVRRVHRRLRRQRVSKRFPNAILHWEDFSGPPARGILARYGDTLCTFDDDIQGTAAVGLACVLAGVRVSGGRLVDQQIVVFGAGLGRRRHRRPDRAGDDRGRAQRRRRPPTGSTCSTARVCSPAT